MKTRSKALLVVLCAVMLAASSVFGTLAYLTDEDQVTNTFTVGMVEISMDESDVDKMGQRLNKQGGIWKEGDALADRVQGNEYKLIPGCTYIKDPTIHVDKDSEEAYLYVELEIRDNHDLMELLKKHDLPDQLWNLLEGSSQSSWRPIGDSKDAEDGTRTYLLAYDEKVAGNGVSDTDIILFNSITVPAAFTKEDLKTLDQFKIITTAYAVQAPSFDTAEEAWSATFGK